MAKRLIRPVVFVHVEKAGGISIHNMLHHFLQGYISPRPLYGPYFDKKDLGVVNRLYPARICGVGGHRLRPGTEYFENQFAFSFVREPISRLLSHLNWQVNKMGLDHTFDSFIDNPYFQNFQTFRLTGTRDLEAAKKIIDSYYDFIGLVEHFDLSISKLSTELFDNPTYLKYQKMNTTTSKDKSYRKKDLTEDQLQKILTLNAVDIAVYKYIRENFEKRYPSSKNGYNVPEMDLQTPLGSRMKRKVSNFYVGRILQPFFQQKQERGF